MIDNGSPLFHISFLFEVKNFGRGLVKEVLAKIQLYTSHGVSKARILKSIPKCREFKDRQGNVFGLFKLGILKPKAVQVLRVDLEISPKVVLPPTSRDFGALDDVSFFTKRKYCRPLHPFWTADSPEISRYVRSIIGEIRDVYEIFRRFFSFLDGFIFRENLRTRRGALKTLEARYGDCDEFSDLFITFCRAVGIPARRLTGLFARPNNPTNHAWAEALAPKIGWLPFDPALRFFACSTPLHIPRKLEATNCEISDFNLRYKGQKGANVKIYPVSMKPKIKRIS